MATPWLGRQLLLRGVASAPPAPPTPLLGGVAGGRASLLRELTSPTRRLRGAASDGITSSPTQRSGNWWQHGSTASTTRRCRRVPLLLDAGPKTQQAGVDSNICMIPRGCTVWEDWHVWLRSVAQRIRTPTPSTPRPLLFVQHQTVIYHRPTMSKHHSSPYEAVHIPHDVSCYILHSRVTSESQRFDMLLIFPLIMYGQ